MLTFSFSISGTTGGWHDSHDVLSNTTPHLKHSPILESVVLDGLWFSTNKILFDVGEGFFLTYDRSVLTWWTQPCGGLINKQSSNSTVGGVELT